MGMVWYREEDEHPVLLVQPAVFHGQAHAVQQDTVQGFGICGKRLEAAILKQQLGNSIEGEQLAGLPIEVIKVCGSCRLFFGHREYPIFQVWNGIH